MHQRTVPEGFYILVTETVAGISAFARSNNTQQILAYKIEFMEAVRPCNHTEEKVLPAEFMLDGVIAVKIPINSSCHAFDGFAFRDLAILFPSHEFVCIVRELRFGLCSRGVSNVEAVLLDLYAKQFNASPQVGLSASFLR